MLAGIDDEKYKYIRKLMIQNILATDMKSHFSMLTHIKNNIQEQGDEYMKNLGIRIFGYPSG